MSEAEWKVCTACGEVKPVFMHLHPQTENLPYCHECGPHRLELEAYPLSMTEGKALFRNATALGKVTEEDFPGGIQCECGKAMLEGDWYAQRANGSVGQVPMYVLCCPDCAGIPIPGATP